MVKPDVVFFGESLPSTFDDALAECAPQVDLLIVMGSSMKVHPVSAIPDLIPPHVPQILINRESLDHNYDIELLGDCDTILADLFKRLQWSSDDECLNNCLLDAQKKSYEIEFVQPRFHLYPGAKRTKLRNMETWQQVEELSTSDDIDEVPPVDPDFTKLDDTPLSGLVAEADS